MKQVFVCLIALALVIPALAQTGNGAPNGPHFNLNIIGVDKAKKTEMTDSSRHTIFVALGGNQASIQTDIWLTPGEDFAVCDGNGFDAATDCAGNPIQVNGAGMPGAVFALPCNTNLSDTTTGGAPVDIVACSGAYPTLSYEVWIRELGKPGGGATMTTCAYELNDAGQQERICSSENVVLARVSKSKPVFKNVTNELTSLVAQMDDDERLERVALFEGGLEDWLWQYDNRGLKLAQLRFYPH
ncbi:MAG TPA: hypothetical protein VN428_07510 [Bryobacteraceae bacterium]|nr:hypothetical protein [Bryobacteraceae bacterium]